MNPKPSKINLGELLVQGLREAVEGLQGVPGKIARVRTYEIPEPQRFDGRKVKRLRNRLALSQAVFAKLVGVSKKLVEAWEGGTRVPSTMACRLLEAIDREPGRYIRVIDVKPGEVDEVVQVRLQRKASGAAVVKARVVKKRVA